jgi:hypothetical protein
MLCIGHREHLKVLVAILALSSRSSPPEELIEFYSISYKYFKDNILYISVFLFLIVGTVTLVIFKNYTSRY